jgi:hypothetical protein
MELNKQMELFEDGELEDSYLLLQQDLMNLQKIWQWVE